MRNTQIQLRLLLALAVAAGCGGQSNEHGHSGPVSASAFPDAVAHAICSNVGSCCAESHLAFTADHCEIALRQIYAAVLSGDAAGFDADAAGECIDAIGAATRRCDFSSSLDTEVCQGLTSSSGRSGSTHGKEGERCDGTCRRSGNTSICNSFGSSVETPDGGVPANPTPVTCYGDDGLYCDFATERCMKPGPVGSTCSSSEACEGSYCNFDTSVCTARQKAGAECTMYGDECTEGLTCSAESPGSDTYSCTPHRALGAPCETDGECESRECRDGNCDVSTTLRLACAP